MMIYTDTKPLQAIVDFFAAKAKLHLLTAEKMKKIVDATPAKFQSEALNKFRKEAIIKELEELSLATCQEIKYKLEIERQEHAETADALEKMGANHRTEGHLFYIAQ